MNILDYVVPKRGWGYLLPQNGTSEEQEPPSAEAEQPEPVSAEAQKSVPSSAEAPEPEPVSAEAQKSVPSSAEAPEPEPVSAEAVTPTAMEASPPPQREEAAASAAPAPEPSPPALEPSPARTDSYSSDGPLEANLRDLFSEASVVDPQLASLLGRIGDVGADDLAAELRDFSRAIGAEGAGSEGRTPG